MQAVQPGKTIGLAWGRGGGKSKFQRLVWWSQIARWDGKRRPYATVPGVRIALVMPTLEQAKKVHASSMIDELEGDWKWLGGKLNRVDWRVTFPGGSWVQWVTAERARNIRGMRCDIISVDECDDVEMSVYDAITLPWFSEHHSLGMSLLSGTPTRGRYGLLYRTIARGLGLEKQSDGADFPNYFASHKTSLDFPEFVSPAMVERARIDMQGTPQLFEREWMCSFDAGEGLVYPHFKTDFHVREPDPAIVWREYLVGVDWGWEDPTVFIVFGVSGHGKDTQIHALAEWVVQHKTDSEVADMARRVDMIYPNAIWYADPSRPQTIAAVKRAAKVRMLPADNAIQDGVATVADSFLIRPRTDGSEWAQLYVAPECEEMIRELGLYRRKRDPRNHDHVLDDIEDRNNHVMDATRYALHTHFGGPDRRAVEGY